MAAGIAEIPIRKGMGDSILIKKAVKERAFWENPGAKIEAKEWAKMNINRETINKQTLTNVKVALAMFQASSSPLFFL